MFTWNYSTIFKMNYFNEAEANFNLNKLNYSDLLSRWGFPINVVGAFY